MVLEGFLVAAFRRHFQSFYVRSGPPGQVDVMPEIWEKGVVRDRYPQPVTVLSHLYRKEVLEGPTPDEWDGKRKFGRGIARIG